MKSSELRQTLRYLQHLGLIPKTSQKVSALPLCVYCILKLDTFQEINFKNCQSCCALFFKGFLSVCVFNDNQMHDLSFADIS